MAPRPIPLLALCAWLAGAACALAETPAPTPSLGPNLERYSYPFPVRWYAASSGGAQVRMAYMDVPAATPARGVTVVLLHGKSYCGATWKAAAAALAAHGIG